MSFWRVKKRACVFECVYVCTCLPCCVDSVLVLICMPYLYNLGSSFPVAPASWIPLMRMCQVERKFTRNHTHAYLMILMPPKIDPPQLLHLPPYVYIKKMPWRTWPATSQICPCSARETRVSTYKYVVSFLCVCSHLHTYACNRWWYAQIGDTYTTYLRLCW